MGLLHDLLTSSLDQAKRILKDLEHKETQLRNKVNSPKFKKLEIAKQQQMHRRLLSRAYDVEQQKARVTQIEVQHAKSQLQMEKEMEA